MDDLSLTTRNSMFRSEHQKPRREKLQKMWKKLTKHHPSIVYSRQAYSGCLRSLGTAAQYVPFYQIDAFTPQPYGGNPAAVLLIPPSIRMEEKAMMKVAEENNLSETCYVRIRPSNPSSNNPFVDHSSFDLKWFTPTKEVNLCGHGTLASAAALFHLGNKSDKLSFHTLSGELIAKRDLNDASGTISLDFPLNVPVVVTKEHEHYHTILGVAKKILELSNAKLDIIKLAYCKVTKKLIVHTRSSSPSLSDLDALKAINVPPPLQVLSFHKGEVVTGVSVLVNGHAPYDFCTRYFSPWNGIPEDPVNGSSHTVLAPYWLNEEIIRNGQPQRALLARQASPRGGDITLKVDFGSKRVLMGGPASTTIVGQMIIPRM
jgi:PhzF family phenazine biosynthesis protein